MRKVTYKGLQCWCDSLRQVDGRAVLVSLYGTQQAVRAIWAAFLEGKAYDLHCGEDRLSSGRGSHFATVTTKIGPGLTHTLVVDDHATIRTPSFPDHFFQLGADADVTWFPRFARYLPIPVRTEWRDYLWKQARDLSMIEEATGFGVPVYRVHLLDPDRWLKLIRKGLHDKEIA